MQNHTIRLFRTKPFTLCSQTAPREIPSLGGDSFSSKREKMHKKKIIKKIKGRGSKTLQTDAVLLESEITDGLGKQKTCKKLFVWQSLPRVGAKGASESKGIPGKRGSAVALWCFPGEASCRDSSHTHHREERASPCPWK